MSLQALRAELAEASAQVAHAAATAVDPWDVPSGEEEDETETESPSARTETQSQSDRDREAGQEEDATPRSIYDEAEQMSGEFSGDVAAGGYSDSTVASVLDPVGSLQQPEGQTPLEFCTCPSSFSRSLLCSWADIRSLTVNGVCLHATCSISCVGRERQLAIFATGVRCCRWRPLGRDRSSASDRFGCQPDAPTTPRRNRWPAGCVRTTAGAPGNCAPTSASLGFKEEKEECVLRTTQCKLFTCRCAPRA